MIVGEDFLEGASRLLCYRDIKTDDPDGWIESKKYLPKECDLVRIKLEDGRIRSGWRQGDKWDGIGIKNKDEVVAWKLYPFSMKQKP